jgi:membrane fusion protein
VQPPSPAKSALFRSEALSAQSSQFLGTIRIATPPRLVAVAVMAIALVAALLAFAILGQATRKAKVAGVLLPPGGLLQISSPQPARLQALRVTEGQTVATGQVLAVLQLGGQSDKGDTATLLRQSLQARMDALQAEARSAQAQAQQREQALGDRLHSLRRDIAQAQGELEATQQRARMAESNLARDQGLSQQGFLSSAQVQTRQEELLDMQVRERGAQRNVEALGREAQSVQAEMQTIRLQAQGQQAQIARTQATLAQEGTELDARNVLHLLASGPATVGAVAAHLGQSLEAGQTVMSLLPMGNSDAISPSLQAQLYAPSRTAGFVEPGQGVWLRLNAFPYQKFGMVSGYVTEVSRTPVLPQDLPSGMANSLMRAAQSQEPLYRVTVALQHYSLQAFGKAQPLKAGMSLEADIVQDRRAIWEWVLEPLLAAKARWKISSEVPPATNPGGM